MQRAYVTVICLLLVGALFSQEIEDLWCHELNTRGGLSAQGYNFYVFCDSQGLVWISSIKGLNRFNGHQVKSYHSDFRDSTALFGENIQSRFYEGADSYIWFCTYEAIHRYNRQQDHFEHFFVLDDKGLPVEEDYNVFHLERDSFLWLRAGRDIHRVDVSDPSRLSAAFAESRPVYTSGYFHSFVGLDENDGVRFIFSCSNEKVIGLERAEITDGRLKDIAVFFGAEDASNPELGVYQVGYESPELVWVSTNKGMARWNMSTMKLDIYPFKFSGYSYFAPEDNRHFIISFYQEGLYRFDRQTGAYQPFALRSAAEPEKPLSRAVRNVYLSKDKVLWITVPGEGLYYTHLDKRKFRAIPQAGVNESGRQYLNFLPSPDDRILLGYERGILIFNREGQQLDQLTSPDRSSVMHLFRERRTGKIMLATHTGIYTCDLDKGSFQRIPGTEGTVFLYLYQLGNGDILASSLHNKIYRIRSGKSGWEVEDIFHSDQRGAGYTTIHEDELEQIYICSNESGLAVFSYQNGELKAGRELDIRGMVYDYYEEAGDSTLWVGTSFGLVKLNKYKLDAPIRSYTINDGLPDNNVYSIIPADRESMWLSTDKGLVKFQKREACSRTFSRSDGMLSEQFRPRSAQKMDDGSIWFGGMKGITVVPPGPIRLIMDKPKLFLSEIRIDDEIPDSIVCRETGTANLNQVNALEYTYKNNTVSFYFAASDYADPLNTQLRYKLENEDEDFVMIEDGASGFARYSNLPSGNYRFVMAAINSDGVEETLEERSIRLRIEPPFWETWWFNSSLILGLLILGAAIFQYRVKQVRQKEQWKTRIAENKMSALIGQMNPHFIFNSLQSVNRYILQKDRRLASQYLGRFSGLIRMMLENSRNSRHLLEEEVKFLTLYLKVEAQRFQLPFEYEIHLTDQVDEGLKIPTMMLQPFLENAIWHGLSHKEEVGHIWVNIHQEDQLLYCRIEDDGVGRKKAAEIAMQKGKKHTSRALEIVKDRLELLFPNQRELCSIQYTDLEDPSGKPTGTRVEIRLPVSA